MTDNERPSTSPDAHAPTWNSPRDPEADDVPAVRNPSSVEEVDVSVIIPTYCEAENLITLVPRVHEVAASAGLTCEIIVVDDDSPDQTRRVCEELADNHPVRLCVRTNERGLSTAVIHGMRLAKGEVLVCMDADWSHPPERIPDLVSAVRSGDSDFAIGSRYVPGGSTEEEWGIFRQWNSRIATWLARPLTRCKDPMAGFFALRRTTFEDCRDLDPVGYKIGLELLVKGNCQKIHEIPIHFRDRVHGESKLSLREQINYLVHLQRLMRYRYQELTRVCCFGAVGLTGMVVDYVSFLVLSRQVALPWARAAAIAIAMTWNFILNRYWTFSQSCRRNVCLQYVRFCSSCLLGAVVNFFVSLSLLKILPDQKFLAVACGVASGFLFNYLICRAWVFRANHSEA